MQIDILTLFPDFFSSPINTSIIKRAIESNKVSINTVNIRNFSTDKHKKADDRPFGGGCGMLMKPEPIFDSVKSLNLKENTKVILLCPTGKKYNQEMAFDLVKEEHLVFLCGHYEGIDQRVKESIITDEISIGDYILTGGELAALTVIDSIVRLIPDVISNEDSFNQDSFSDGLLDCPHYTRPSDYNGLKVPDVLLSGNHKLIEDWRLKEKLKITLTNRPDLFKKYNFSNVNYKILEIVKKETSNIDRDLSSFLQDKINQNKVKKKDFSLDELKWDSKNKVKLEELIKENSFQNKKVIFDFDNTLLCRDIGEYTFYNLVTNNLIDIDRIKEISPNFVLNNQLVSLEKSSPIEYYEKFMLSTYHQNNDESEIINGYTWLVQSMYGLSLKDIVLTAKNAFINESDNSQYLKPFFNNEMIDLIGNLLKNGFKVNIVSASNVWIVRFLVTEFLNPLLKNRYKKEINPQNVFGINTLIIDKRNQKLYKDIHLIKTNKLYLNGDLKELENFEITNQLVFPISAFDGKYIIIEKYILSSEEKPFLIAGDSLNDLPMLIRSENKLWIERIEKSDYHPKIKKYINDSWIIQKSSKEGFL